MPISGINIKIEDTRKGITTSAFGDASKSWWNGNTIFRTNHGLTKIRIPVPFKEFQKVSVRIGEGLQVLGVKIGHKGNWALGLTQWSDVTKWVLQHRS